MKQIVKKITILCMALVLCLSTLNLQVAYANEEPINQPVNQPEQPSMWALEDVQMLSIYDIIDLSMFSDYNAFITNRELYTVGIRLYEKITGENVTDEDISIDDMALIKASYKVFNVFLQQSDLNLITTRKNVVDVLYGVIKKSAPTFEYNYDYIVDYEDITPSDNVDSVKYLVSNRLLNGVSDERLELNNSCTKEQLFALASRTYYYVIQKLDKAAKGLFWKVEGEKSTVYLLGSIHIADSSIYPMNDDILNAYDSSDALSVEVDIFGSAEGLAYMQEKMVYQDGTTIDQVLSKETYKLYVDKMESLGIKKEQYDVLKPWSAAFFIQNSEAAESSIQAGLGVDVFLMSKALNTKPIIEIEGYKFQTDLFNSFNDEIQEAFLLSSLISPENNTDSNSDVEVLDNVAVITNMLAAWKSGDIKGIEKYIVFDENNVDEFNKKFLVERNEHMYENVLNYLNDDEGKTYFVVVGAAHMITNSGIVKKLKDKGYEVEQIR
ncbi:hypothetical protein SH1V18_19790 [Vallitalea longa]|uniref:Uncharacterized protein n=1 Tax=Vallitalea longa TaxID=2936439 RepID=A0A9W5YCP7_9FIRM|nr:TraB/GumN family protein [Vallitalea longa]GKX29499.1 hypothetical protein SH1V18_19790 [Vallitalea longa]